MAGFPCCCPGECVTCTCENCLEEKAPCCWQVVIAGIVDIGTGTGDCQDCSRLNKTYKLSEYEPAGTGTGTGTGTGSGGTAGDCYWEDERVCGDCTPERISLEVVEESGDYIVRVTLGEHIWEKNYSTTKPSCCNVSGVDIPHVTDSGDCDSSSATCTLTALADDASCVSSRCAVAGCICDNWPSEVAVDLAEGGWVANTCSYCPDVKGVYILEEVVAPVCRGDLILTVCEGEGGEDGVLNFLLDLVVVSGTTVRWELEVRLDHLAEETQAIYRSATWDLDTFPECWHLSDDQNRIELTKWSESTESGPCVDPDFGGQLPDPIYISDANA